LGILTVKICELKWQQPHLKKQLMPSILKDGNWTVFQIDIPFLPFLTLKLLKSLIY
jgi:hypothetical protein